MPTFISLKAPLGQEGVFGLAEDPFTNVGDEQSVPPTPAAIDPTDAGEPVLAG